MKRTIRKTIIAVMAVLCICALFLFGCAKDVDDGTIKLSVVTEASHTNSTECLNSSILHWKFKFESEHKNVTVEIEELPSSGEERSIMMERIRAELMAGKGPDVLLLPATGIWNLPGTTQNLGNPLIIDVNQAMQNDIFYDISAYYDADTELDKESLVTAVMDAGVIDGKRFALPLRYDMPVAYVDMKLFEEEGFSIDLFNSSITDLWDAITQSKNSKVAAAAQLRNMDTTLLNFFPKVIDYQNQEVLINRDDLAKFIRSYQSLRATMGSVGFASGSFVTLMDYLYGESSWINSGYCMNVVETDSAIQSKCIATLEGVDLGMFPLRAIDGSLVAEVTYYGAISAGCKHPDAAYEFLRYFLTEDAQWEKDIDVSFAYRDYFAGDGWPVRINGSVPYLSYSLYNRISNKNVNKQQFSESGILMLNDEDIPILVAQIDHGRFPIPLESGLTDVLIETYDIELHDKTNVDIDALADNYIQQLEWHMGEG